MPADSGPAAAKADGAAALAAHPNERSAEALHILVDVGRQAMGELRRVLGVMREEQKGEGLRSPRPRVRDVDHRWARG